MNRFGCALLAICAASALFVVAVIGCVVRLIAG